MPSVPPPLSTNQKGPSFHKRALHFIRNALCTIKLALYSIEPNDASKEPRIDVLDAVCTALCLYRPLPQTHGRTHARTDARTHAHRGRGRAVSVLYVDASFSS